MSTKDENILIGLKMSVCYIFHLSEIYTLKAYYLFLFLLNFDSNSIFMLVKEKGISNFRCFKSTPALTSLLMLPKCNSMQFGTSSAYESSHNWTPFVKTNFWIFYIILVPKAITYALPKIWRSGRLHKKN